MKALLWVLMAIVPAAAMAAPPVDDARVAATGIRKLSGRRLTLYTDLTGKEIDRLPAVFEQAFPQWCKYFGVSQRKHADWHVTGCLMKDRAKFIAAGLMPKNLPPFKHGYSVNDRLWLDEQPSDFYRRELLLHEGTHSFMFTLLGSCGPPWYMEGLAEYLATHRLEDGRLTLGYMPKSRDEAPQWGRVRIIQNAVTDVLSLFPPHFHLDLAGVVGQFAGRVVDFEEECAGLGRRKRCAEANRRGMQKHGDAIGRGIVRTNGCQQDAKRATLVVADRHAAGFRPPDRWLLGIGRPHPLPLSQRARRDAGNPKSAGGREAIATARLQSQAGVLPAAVGCNGDGLHALPLFDLARREIDGRTLDIVAVFHVGHHELPLFAQLPPIGLEQPVEAVVEVRFTDP